MREWIAGFVGEGLAPIVTVLVAAAIVILLALVVIGLAKRLFSGAGGMGAKSRAPRLAILDVAGVDQKRKLVLVRRDEVEHLLLIGGQNDLVVEQSILRVPSAARRGRVEPAMRPAADPASGRPTPATPPSAQSQKQPATPEVSAPPPAPVPAPATVPQVDRPEPRMAPTHQAPAEAADMRARSAQQPPVAPRPARQAVPAGRPVSAEGPQITRAPAAPSLPDAPSRPDPAPSRPNETSAVTIPPVAAPTRPAPAKTASPAPATERPAPPVVPKPAPQAKDGADGQAPERPLAPPQPVQPRSMATPTLPAPQRPAPAAPSIWAPAAAQSPVSTPQEREASGEAASQRDEAGGAPAIRTEPKAEPLVGTAGDGPTSGREGVMLAPEPDAAPSVEPPVETRQPLSVRSFASTIQNRPSSEDARASSVSRGSAEATGSAAPKSAEKVDPELAIPAVTTPGATSFPTTDEAEKPTQAPASRPLTLEEEMEKLLQDFTIDVSDRR